MNVVPYEFLEATKAFTALCEEATRTLRLMNNPTRRIDLTDLPRKDHREEEDQWPT